MAMPVKNSGGLGIMDPVNTCFPGRDDSMWRTGINLFYPVYNLVPGYMVLYQ